MYKHIVANKGQELDVLGKLEEEGFVWVNTHVRPTSLLISESDFAEFPYVIIADSRRMTIEWSTEEAEFNGDVFFDGRKEEKMTNKYKVTKEFMNKLVEWRGTRTLDTTTSDFLSHVAPKDLDSLPSEVETWWYSVGNSMERNRRLIAIISWLNGEDVFEVEKPRKFVIRSEKPNWDGDYWFVRFKEGMDATTTHLSKASKFSSYAEASEWANSHQVVVEIDADGNEV